MDLDNALLPRSMVGLALRKNSTANSESKKKIHKEKGEEMISRRDIDELFLWILPMIVIGNGITWSIYFHIHNLINSLSMDQFWIVIQSGNFDIAWILLEYFRHHYMQPCLCASFAFCGLALVWLLWSWALNNGFDSSSR